MPGTTSRATKQALDFGLDARPDARAKLAQELPIETGVQSQTLGDRQNHLPVRDGTTDVFGHVEGGQQGPSLDQMYIFCHSGAACPGGPSATKTDPRCRAGREQIELTRRPSADFGEFRKPSVTQSPEQGAQRRPRLPRSVRRGPRPTFRP